MLKSKVVVAMSGGVDSSVSACLLHEAGHAVIGLFMRVGPSSTPGSATLGRANKQGCCSATDAADARRVAQQLGIPFYVLNFHEEFERLQDYFADQYANGRTPNPCVVCNSRLKFGRLLDYADLLGAEFVATGHYARLGQRDGRRVLLRGQDVSKDQSYVLFDLPAATLQRVLLPIGELTKRQVRQRARRFGLQIAEKRDSQEICFVPEGDYQRVVRARRPDAYRPGPVVDETGRRLGTHPGVAAFTVGQRRGLGVALGEPRYVTRIEAASGTVVVGPRGSLLADGLIAERCNWLLPPPTGPRPVTIKIRRQHRPAAGEVRPAGDGLVEARFARPQPAVTPGQAAVFYDGEVVVGGGWIQRSLAAGQSG